MLASHIPEVDARWMHEYVPSTTPSAIFWRAKDFTISPEVDPDAGVKQLVSYDGLGCAHECPDVFTMFYDVLTITPEL